MRFHGKSGRRAIAAIALAGAGALALAGCTTSGTSGDDETSSGGSTITIAQTNEFTSFNNNTPQSNLDINGMVGYLTGTSSGAGLGGFYYLDDAFKIVQNDSIGTYEKTSDDPLTITYTLNEDAKWSDGEPITADDLLYGWAVASGYYDSATTDADGNVTAGTQYFVTANPTVGVDQTAFPEISDDNLSMTLTYAVPYVDWELTGFIDKPLHVAAEQAGVSLEEAVAAFKETPKGDPANPAPVNETIKGVADFYNTGYDVTAMPEDLSLTVGSGPFVVTDYTAKQSMTLEKNEYYTGDLAPEYDKLIIRFIGDTNAQVAALQNGEVDAIQPQPSADTLTALESANATVLQGEQLSYDHLDLNFGSPVFADKNVREAFLKTVPRQQILDAIVTPVTPDAKVLDSQIFVPANEPYEQSVAENGSAAYAEVDIEGAKALLAGATPTVKILYNTENPNRVDEFAAIQASAAQAGFNVVDGGSPDWGSLLGGGDYDASLFGWISPGAGTTALPQIFAFPSDSNYNKWNNAEATKAANDSQTQTDPAEVVKLQLLIDKATFTDAYGLPLFQSPGLFATNGGLDGVKYFGGQTGIVWNAWEWTKS